MMCVGDKSFLGVNSCELLFLTSFNVVSFGLPGDKVTICLWFQNACCHVYDVGIYMIFCPNDVTIEIQSKKKLYLYNLSIVLE